MLLNIKKEEMFPFVTTPIESENIMRKEIISTQEDNTTLYLPAGVKIIFLREEERAWQLLSQSTLGGRRTMGSEGSSQIAIRTSLIFVYQLLRLLNRAGH